MLKRMVIWSGGGAGGKSRADGLRGRRGRDSVRVSSRVSRGGLVGEDEDEELALPAPLPLLLALLMVPVGFRLLSYCGGMVE